MKTIQRYLNEKVTKKELAKIFTNQELSRSLTEMNIINNDLMASVKNLDYTFRTFPDVPTLFYQILTQQTFPYLTEETKDDYLFLEEMMSLYNNLGGKELLKEHLMMNGEILGRQLPDNGNFTEHNIWLALGDSVRGFQVDGSAVTASGMILCL